MLEPDFLIGKLLGMVVGFGTDMMVIYIVLDKSTMESFYGMVTNGD